MIAMYASEAREDFESHSFWFFVHQCFLALEHLTDIQKCDVETISYAGIVNKKHVWVGRA